MSGTGTPPSIPEEFQTYNSYVIDPKWQRTFIWDCVLYFLAFFVFSTPHLWRAIRNRRAFTDILGLRQSKSGTETGSGALGRGLQDQKHREGRTSGAWRALEVSKAAVSLGFWRIPRLGLNLGQLSVIIIYVVTEMYCVTHKARLAQNANRAGFLAVAQVPVVILLACKNSLLSFLLGPGNGYEKLNFIHRWAGRALYLAAAIHGFFWVRNRFQWDLQIIGERKATTGLLALTALTLLVLTSLKPVRDRAYQVFFALHVILYTAFITGLYYHTRQSYIWITPALLFYSLDSLLRLIKYRFKRATLEAVDHQMTLIRVSSLDAGWNAGQHVKIRVFFSGRAMESHPFTILSAPSSISCLSAQGGVILGAKVAGDWTKALNNYAQASSADSASTASATVMIDGPYGGSSLDLGLYETAVLIAGGSGATFTLGVLDDLVGRCVHGRKDGERTRVIEFVWYIKNSVDTTWFSSMLADISQAATDSSAGLDLRITFIVTRGGETDSIVLNPSTTVLTQRISPSSLLQRLLPLRSHLTSDEESSVSLARGVQSSTPGLNDLDEAEGLLAEDDAEQEKSSGTTSLKFTPRFGSGVGICAAGPSSLTSDLSNAVAALTLKRWSDLGSVGLHTETYSM